MKKLPFFRFKTSLFAIVMLVAALFSCSKDRPELTSPNNPTAHISTQVLEQAKKGIKDPAVANFFDIGFAEQANANIVPVASGRSDEELINGLAYELLRLNENYNFVPTLISRAGYPYWSRADIYYAAGTGMASDTPVVLLPFAHLGSDSVEAVMLAMPLTDTAGWYTTIFTRKSVDSLIAVTANDVYGLGYKVLAFFRLDIALFQNPSQSHYNWLINAANGSNLVSVQDRCGLYQIGYCHEILLLYPHGLLPDGGVQNRDPGIDLCISFYIPCGTGASAGSSGVFCELNENFDWICDYMQTNPNPNGGGSGPNDGPNNTPPGDVGTRILNMHNNGEISEEDMNRLLTVHSIMGLTNNQVEWLKSDPAGFPTELKHLISIEAFLLEYGHEEGAKEHAKTHLNQMMEDPEYRKMATASFAWPEVVWSIAQELVGDALVDLLLNQIPFFNNQDEVRDIIKSAKSGNWLEFSYEVTKLVFKTLLKNNPYAKAVQAIWEGSEKAAKIGKALDKIGDLLNTMSTQTLERAWGILKKMGGKLFEIEDLPKYLKYIDDLKTPKLGGYFATVNTYNPNFKKKFSDVEAQVKAVHHAVPQNVKNTYGLIHDTELHSLENLRGIPVTDDFHQELTTKWNTWYTQNPGFTLQDALNYAKVLDDDYGHRFVPPIR